MKITKFEKFLEGLPHIFPLIYKHTDASKHEKYSTMIFEKLNSLVIRNAQGKSRFNEIDKVFFEIEHFWDRFVRFVKYEAFFEYLALLVKKYQRKNLAGCAKWFDV